MTNDDPQRIARPAAGATGDVVERHAGRSSRVAASYPRLGRALEGEGRSAPTIDDAATIAVEGRGSGVPVEPAIAAHVGAHLGADFGSVRVHQDPLSQEATAAMGARAFAYGSDVFLAAHESGGDLGLMAHELTHVAQQGAAGARTPQRRVEVGAADSPAEREAEQVATAVVAGPRTGALIVDDGPAQAGQMLKSTFVAELRAAVTAAADAELGPALSAVGCPYLDSYFRRYSTRPAAEIESLLRRFAPGASEATSAAAMIPAVCQRVQRGVRAWRDTGETPTELPDLEASEVPSPRAAAMGPGAALPATAAPLLAAFGEGFADVRVHTGPEAARFAAHHDALAVTVGQDIAFASGAYEPGTIAGDALLAHELAHVQQQRGGDTGALPSAATAGAAHEADADLAAAGAVRAAHAPKARPGDRVAAMLRAPLELARCTRSPAAVGPFHDPVPPATTPDDLRVAAARAAFDSHNSSVGPAAANHIDAALRAAAGNNAALMIEFYTHYTSNAFSLSSSVPANLFAQTSGGATDVSLSEFNSMDLIALGSALLHEMSHTRQPYSSAAPADAEAFAYGVDMFFSAYGVGTVAHRNTTTTDRLPLVAGVNLGDAIFTAADFNHRRDAAFACLRALYLVIDGPPTPAPWAGDSSAPAFLNSLTPDAARTLSAQFVHGGGVALTGDLAALWQWCFSSAPTYLSLSTVFPASAATTGGTTGDAGTDAGPVDAGPSDAGRSRRRRRRSTGGARR